MIREERKVKKMKNTKHAVSMKPVTYILFFVIGTVIFLCLARNVKIPVYETDGQNTTVGTEESISLFEAIFSKGGNI